LREKRGEDLFLQKKAAVKKPTRGRPLKYGRPARVVAVTLPEDTLDELRGIHPDLGRAIVMLVNAFTGTREIETNRPIVDYEKVGRRRSLIVVDRDAVKGVPGCDLIPLSDERAFLALPDGSSLPDLELAIIDRLADHNVTGRQREGLEALRRALMECRRADDVEVESRSIFVVEKSARPR
jgi:hypothetical protein